jgi:uncharacterized membrane protein
VKIKTSTLGLVALALVFTANSPQLSMARTNEPSQPESVRTGSEPSVFEQKIGTKTYASGSVLVKAKVEKIWEILTDYENSPEIFSSVKKCHVIEDRGSTKLVQQVVHPKGSPMKFDYVVEIAEKAPRLMEWHRKSGALKDVSGSWKLEPDSTNRNTIITYSIYIDGGLFLPSWLLRGQSKNLLPEVLNSVKGAAERAAADAGTTGSGKS